MILKKLRKDAGITQSQLANELGIGQATVSQWESGLSKPTADAIIALSKFYDVSSDFILGISLDKEGDAKMNRDVEECLVMIDNLTHNQRRIVKELLQQFKPFD